MKAAKRYAKALFEIASANMDVVQKDMQYIEQVFNEYPELVKTVKDPTIAPSVKLNIINKIFKENVTDETIQLIQLLGKKDRLNLLKDIAVSFDKLYKNKKGIREAEVITAVPVTDKLKNQILKKIKDLTGSNEVKLTNKVDPDIIGGFILNMDDLRYDASISGKLAKIKQKLLA